MNTKTYDINRYCRHSLHRIAGYFLDNSLIRAQMVFFGLRRAASTLWLYLGGGAVPKYGAIGHLRFVTVGRVKKHVSVGGATPLTSNNQLNRVGLQFDQNSERKNMGAWVDGI